MPEIMTRPGCMVCIRPAMLGLSHVTECRIVPASDDCPTLTMADGFVVNPQKPGTYYAIALSEGKAHEFAIVCEKAKKSAGMSLRLMAVGEAIINGVKSLGGPTLKYGGVLALGVALTMAPKWCDGIPEWLKPKPHPVVPVDPPKPPAPPAPIVGDGLHVLIVYESADLQKLPVSQVSALKSQTVRDYLDGRCAKEGNGRAAWRVWDKDTNTAEDLKTWQDAMKRPRASLPWVIISDGRTGYEGPFPSTTDATLELLKKWGNP